MADPVVICYSDGSERSYKTIEEAEGDIMDVFSGSDGMTTVDSAEQGNVELGCEWSIKLEPL